MAASGRAGWAVAGGRGRRAQQPAPAAGLGNAWGQNNCYLNAAVQAITRVRAVRSLVAILAAKRGTVTGSHPLALLVDETARAFRSVASPRHGTGSRDLAAFRASLRAAVELASEKRTAAAETLRDSELGDAGEALELVITSLFRAERWLASGGRDDKAEKALLPCRRSDALDSSVVACATCVVQLSLRCGACGAERGAGAVSARVTEPVMVSEILLGEADEPAERPSEPEAVDGKPRAAKGAERPEAAEGRAEAAAGEAAPASRPGPAPPAAPAGRQAGPAWGAGRLPSAVVSAGRSARSRVDARPALRAGDCLARLSRSSDRLLRCDACGAGGRMRSSRRLLRGGEVLAVQLVWPSGAPGSHALGEARRCLGDLFVDLCRVFDAGAEAPEAGREGRGAVTRLPARLRACVLFRAAHFVVVSDVSGAGEADDAASAAALAWAAAHPGTGAGEIGPWPGAGAALPSWACIDDETVSKAASPWDHCSRLGLAPCLLLFESLGPGAAMPADGGRAMMSAAERLVTEADPHPAAAAPAGAARTFPALGSV